MSIAEDRAESGREALGDLVDHRRAAHVHAREYAECPECRALRVRFALRRGVGGMSAEREARGIQRRPAYRYLRASDQLPIP